jgi:hypothetical protein
VSPAVPTKNPPIGGFFVGSTERMSALALFQLGLFVHHMLASFGIELHDLHFLRHGAFVLAGRVEMTGSGSRFEFDFVAHDVAPKLAMSLDRNALGAQFSQHDIDTLLVDGAQASVGQAQTHPTVFRFDPETAVLQIRQETTLGFIVGVGNIVTHHWGFARYLANTCHD